MEISNVISTCKIIPSKPVDFSVSSNHLPEKIIENAWGIGTLSLPSVKVSNEDIKGKWEHLKYISTEMSNMKISLLIGADIPRYIFH